MMAIGSLFAGIGGLELGISEATGVDVGWQCEIDPFCRRVLAKHWPKVRRFEDVTKLRGDMVGPTSILTAGFPCTDLSFAGKGAGIENGKKSGLWREVARLIGEIRPSYVVLENVPAILSRGLDIVLGDLAAGGYDATWDCIPASSCGAPHRRDRWFLIGWRENNGDVVQPGSKSPWKRAMADANGASGEGVRVTVRVSPQLARADSPSVAPREWTNKPGVGRVDDGLPNRVHRLRALGNAVVPAVSYRVGLALLDIMKRRGDR